MLNLSRYEDGYDQMKDDDTSLRLVAENLKLEISTLNQELINKQAEFSSSETSLRNEVKRLCCERDARLNYFVFIIILRFLFSLNLFADFFQFFKCRLFINNFRKSAENLCE